MNVTGTSTPPSAPPPPPPPPPPRRSWLDVVEAVGNKLPEPALLFAILAAIVIVASAVGDRLGWKVQPVQLKVELVEKVDATGSAVLDAEGKPMLVARHDESGKVVTKLQPVGKPLEPRNLLTSDGIYWMLSSMIRNFVTLPALGLVVTGMLGIGLAEKFGLFSALMRAIALATPRRLITPVIVFVGANSSVASDAGYIVLPPLAAALYLAMGRHPVAGLAAAFAGVAGGFGGGCFPTASDGFLAGVATTSAHIIDQGYPTVLATHNWYFKIGSALVVMAAGWYVTDAVVEPRLRREAAAKGVDAGIPSAHDLALNAAEKRGLALAMVAMVVVVGLFTAMVLMPGLPLHGRGVPTLASGQALVNQPMIVVDGSKLTEAGIAADRVLFTQPPTNEDEVGSDGKVVSRVIDPGFVVASSGRATLAERPGDRWSQVIVPMILLTFLVPGMVYGWATGVFRTQKDFIEAIYHGVRSIVPVIVISFFLGQFVNYFTYTGLDRMIAYAGGSLLVQADLPVPLLIVLFVLLVVAGDFAMSGMLAKFGVMAPIFIPMFMMVGISPELTTAAYRIGDSVVNIITPLNSYLLIILVVLQKYKRDAGLGTLISLMLPYSMALFALWTGFLLVWYFAGFPLGTQAPLTYTPSL